MSQSAAYKRNSRRVNLATRREGLCQWNTNPLRDFSSSHNLCTKVLFRFKAFFLSHRTRCPVSCRPACACLWPTPASRPGSEWAPWRRRLPCVSAWTSWSAGTQWAWVASGAEPPQSCWGWGPRGSSGPAVGRRSCWEAACVCAQGSLRCCSREVPAACWLLLVAAGRRWWPSCLKLTWGSTGSGSLAGGGRGVEDWWLWRTGCHSWITRLSRCYSLPMKRALVPGHPPYGQKRKEQRKQKTHQQGKHGQEDPELLACHSL